MKNIMNKFKAAVESLATKLVEAVGGPDTLGLSTALWLARSHVVHHPALNGGVYDPEIPVRLAIIEAALEKVSVIEDDWWWDFLYQSPTRGYTSNMEEKEWDRAGWLDLLDEVVEFGQADLEYQAGQIKSLLNAEGFRFNEKDYDRLLQTMEPPVIVRWREGSDVVLYVQTGGIMSAAAELADVCERLGVQYKAA